MTDSYTKTDRAVYNLYHIAPLYEWDDFEREVRLLAKAKGLSRRHLALSPKGLEGKENHSANEQTFVGDENSVHGRVFENDGGLVTSVLQDEQILCCFGDASASLWPTDSHGFPDVVLMTNDGCVRFVREMVIPWVHKLHRAMRNERRWRKFMGQTSRYMWLGGCKYGFLSTYDETVFLKQDIDPQNPGGYALFYSDIILHSTSSEEVPGPNPQPEDFRNTVSLRECMLYIGREIQNGNWPLANTMTINQWII
ncbi:hypothetical protein F5884DRAFT_754579 [Xylogone sp. PMI_703]|nr:hypothetical protein F5884DRAFT_754579 [Xylogone sp. PMI_703]